MAHRDTLLSSTHVARVLSTVTLAGFCVLVARPAAAEDRVYFSATDNISAALVQRINAETARIDIAAWYLTDRAITTALLRRFEAGVQVRLLGDRGSIFEIDPPTRREFYRLAAAGVPIRLRYHPTWYPEIMHWKATIFAGQGLVAFGSANYTPFELKPTTSSNYKDEVVLFADDPSLVFAFKTQFDRMWNDTTREPLSRIGGPPYLLNWDDACALEPACADYRELHPNPKPMVVNTARLEGDHPLPSTMVWGQGAALNQRLVQEINNEASAIDMVIYRLTVPGIAEALIAKHRAGVRVRLIVEPNEYRNSKWPEFWLTHAYVDQLWAAGIPIKWRRHQGLTHMKVLITSHYATVGSSNFAAAWQRDHNYFIDAAGKPGVYQAIKSRFERMWRDTTGFANFAPGPPNTPELTAPASTAINVSTGTSLEWTREAFATAYYVYLGTSSNTMRRVATVPARLVNDPPETYSWTPPAPLGGNTTYMWKIVARTNAAIERSSATRTFTTGAGAAAPLPPPTPPLPTPAPRPPAPPRSPSPPAPAPPSPAPPSPAPPSPAPPSPAPPAPAPPVPAPPSPAPTPAPTPPPAPAPAAPHNVTATVRGTQVTIAWDAAAGVQTLSQVIEVGLASGHTVLTIDAPPQARSLTQGNVPLGTYYLRVRAVTPAGLTPASNEVVVTVGSEMPTTPADLHAAVDGSRVTLSWSPGPAPTDAAVGYIVEAGFAPGTSAFVMPVGSRTTIAITEVPAGTYYVRVRAVRGEEMGGASNEVRIVVSY